MSEMIIDSTSYTNKDFRTIFPELLELVRGLTNTWDPVNSNESDPGVALLKIQAFIADKLNYNIDKNVLDKTENNVIIIDLASAPGGVDFEYAKQKNRKVIFALSLPGKVAPETAGNIIANTVLSKLSEVYL